MKVVEVLREALDMAALAGRAAVAAVVEGVDVEPEAEEEFHDLGMAAGVFAEAVGEQQ